MNTSDNVCFPTYLCIQDSNVRQFKIEILIHTMECSSDAEIILEFDNDVLTDQTFEKGEEKHF